MGFKMNPDTLKLEVIDEEFLKKCDEEEQAAKLERLGFKRNPNTNKLDFIK